MEKVPFMPKLGEKYWTYNSFGGIGMCACKYVWSNSGLNKQRKAFNIVFKTKQDAINYLPTWEKFLQGETK